MRTFIAVDLDVELKKNILFLMDECKKLQKQSIKYVEDNNLHITVKFLGDTKPEVLKQMLMDLENIKTKPIELVFKGAGGFPNVFFPRVMWVGIRENELFKELFNKIEAVTDKYGFPKETRDFHPHITIARVNGNVNKELVDLLKLYKDRDMGVSKISSFVLYKSELTPKGPIYSRLKEFSIESI